ncbi:desulfoferrodoxin family protein [Sneathiella sp.]|uniref:desulfoferrodoxin family protein n=1 Tax=Sneathiella sp. TaxID=1964365 RepID=UPI0035641AE2
MEHKIPGLNRRQALAMAGGGATALLASATPTLAAESCDMQAALRMLAGKIFYSTDEPGRWAGKEPGHSPLIKVDKAGKDVLVRAATRHPMEADHFILKHLLMDADLNVVHEQYFDKSFDLPRSRFELNGYKGRLYIVSICNVHDNWINWADV